MDKEQRSPLKARPLRSPGQSCEERRRQLLQDKIEQPLLIAAVMIVFMGTEFWRAYWNYPPSPWIAASFAVLAIGFAAYRVKTYWPEARNLQLGSEGERAVGQFLDRLRSEGFEVFHDVPGEAFNVDHVLVGPAGVVSIETKTWTKPKRGDPRITFADGTLLRNGQAPARDPIAQARAQSGWLSQLIEEGTGLKVGVRPVVLIPGWFVEQPEASRKQVWVLEPKALPSFLRQEPNRLSSEQVRVVAFHVSRYIRTFEADG